MNTLSQTTRNPPPSQARGPRKPATQRSADQRMNASPISDSGTIGPANQSPAAISHHLVSNILTSRIAAPRMGHETLLGDSGSTPGQLLGFSNVLSRFRARSEE